MQSVVFFDGHCNLCNQAVQFIIERDRLNYFKFASLQGSHAKETLNKFGLKNQNFNSFILLEGDRLFTQSTAALRVVKKLRGLWPLLYVLILIPPFIRNYIYSYIANRRYKWFGKQETCWVPTAATKLKFLD